ncbi:MAG: Na+/H+ antiporter subunit G [Luteimonas sp.]
MSAVLDVILGGLLVVGCFFILLGAFALLKLRDFFQRVHGPAKASTLGVGCILVASIIYHWVNGSGVHPREILITVFLFLTAPISAHLMSRAALSLMDDRPPEPGRTPDANAPVVDHDDPAPPERT